MDSGISTLEHHLAFLYHHDLQRYREDRTEFGGSCFDYPVLYCVVSVTILNFFEVVVANSCILDFSVIPAGDEQKKCENFPNQSIGR